MTGVALDLLLLDDRYSFCSNAGDNPGFVLQSTPVVFNGATYDVWRMTGVSIPSISQGGTLTIKARVKVVGFINDPDPSIAFRATWGTEVIGINPGPLVIIDGTFITVGTDPGSVNNLLDVATGQTGFLALPPAGPGQDVVINGTLIIDANYTFGGQSDILMGENAKLQIIGTKTLTLKDLTWVRSCDLPWQGIEVASNGGLKSEGGQEVIIEDAQRAVTAVNLSNLTLGRTRFRNNGIGVYSPLSSGMPQEILGSITRCTFESTPTAKLVGVAGCYFNDVDNLKLTRNIYRNLDYGLYLFRSSVGTSLDLFSNIRKVGVFGRGSGQIVSVKGNGNAAATPSFENCPIGIQTIGINLTATDNAMLSVNTGITMFSAPNRWARITTNLINARNVGIVSSLNRPLDFSILSGNDININGNGQNGMGIRSTSSGTQNGGTITYANNIIHLGDAAGGIEANSNVGVVFDRNSVFMDNAKNYQGIFVGSGSANSFLCNILEGFSTDIDQIGVDVNQSPFNTISCNTFDDTRAAVRFLGANLSTDLAGNSFNSIYNGVQVGVFGGGMAGLIGVQNHRGNRWMETPALGGFGAAHYSPNPDDVENSKLVVNPSGGSNLISTQFTTSGVPFFKSEGGNTFACGGTTAGCPRPDPPGVVGSTWQKLALNQLTVGSTYSTAETWTARRQLYQHLKQNPALAPSGSTLASFVAAQASTSVGQLEDLGMAIDQLTMLPATTASQLSGLRDGVMAKFGEMDAIDAALELQPGNTALLAQRSAKQAEIAALNAQIRPIEDAHAAAIAVGAATLLATNAAMPTSTVYESNQRTANRILLEMMANGEYLPTPAQVADLQPVALQCPFAGGDGVYLARALLNDGVVYDDVAICQPAQPLRKPEEEIVGKSVAFRIYPNPANGLVVLELEQPLEHAGKLSVANTLGQLVHSQALYVGDAALPLDLAGMPAGLYFVTIQANDRVSIQQFVVSK